jgi:hypothetical protein
MFPAPAHTDHMVAFGDLTTLTFTKPTKRSTTKGAINLRHFQFQQQQNGGGGAGAPPLAHAHSTAAGMSPYMPTAGGQAPRQRSPMYTPHGTAAGAYSPLQPQALDAFFDPSMTAQPTYTQPPHPYMTPMNANAFAPDGFGAHASFGPTPFNASPTAPHHQSPLGYATAQTPFQRASMPMHTRTGAAPRHPSEHMYMPADPAFFRPTEHPSHGPPSTSGASLYSEPRVQDVTGLAQHALFGGGNGNGSATPLAMAGALVQCAPNGGTATNSHPQGYSMHGAREGGGDEGGGDDGNGGGGGDGDGGDGGGGGGGGDDGGDEDDDASSDTGSESYEPSYDGDTASSTSTSTAAAAARHAALRTKYSALKQRARDDRRRANAAERAEQRARSDAAEAQRHASDAHAQNMQSMHALSLRPQPAAARAREPTADDLKLYMTDLTPASLQKWIPTFRAVLFAYNKQCEQSICIAVTRLTCRSWRTSPPTAARWPRQTARARASSARY